MKGSFIGAGFAAFVVCIGLRLVVFEGRAADRTQDKRAAEDDDDVDRLGLASLLVSDGHLDRAMAELDAIDLGLPGLDLRRLWTLRAIIYIQRSEAGAGQWADAADAIERARNSSTVEIMVSRPSLEALLARCRAELGLWPEVIAALQWVAAEEKAASPELLLLDARASMEVGDRQRAFTLLSSLVAERPELAQASRLFVYLLVELELYKSAAEVGERWVAAGSATLDDQLTLAESLRRGRAFPEALAQLERLTLSYPRDGRVLRTFAKTLADANRPLAGAELLARAALVDPTFALDAAELYRRAGRAERALWLNAMVLDQPSKVRQRLGILLDLERFEEVVAMGERVLRLDVATDDLVYALAFAAFRTGRFDEAARWLDRIRSADLFERASALRASMALCRSGQARCE